MKTRKWFLLLATAITASLTLNSCLDDDNETNDVTYPNALVTLKTSQSKGFYLQLDDSTIVIPTNIKTSPYGKREIRALANFSLDKNQSGHYAKSAYINWIDTILTKNMVADMGEQNATVYGNDPIELVNDWTTLVEDDYLTLRFRTYFGGSAKHVLNLVKTDSLYVVELHHNAQGDLSGTIHDGLVAFSLADLPDTGGKTVDLTVKWRSFSGEKSVKFKYHSRKSAEEGKE